jgi:hypothetical protein
MGMKVPSFLVIVHQFDIKGILALETKDDAPVGSDGHGLETLKIAFERVQAIAGQIESLRCGSRVENREDSFHGVQEIGANPAAVAAFIEAL